MFGKKTTAEDVLKMFETLSDDEKKKVMDAVKPTTEEQIEKAETDIAEKGEDSQTEKDRIDESVGEQEKEDGNEDSQTAKDRVDESEGMEKAEETKDLNADENRDKIIKALEDRVSALENGIKALSELKSKMEEYAEKQADTFGYKGKDEAGGKNMDDMTAEELKKHILSGN